MQLIVVRLFSQLFLRVVRGVEAERLCTDIFFGSMIDKTHSKLGKARPWMLYGYIGCAITLVGIFAIPMGMSEFAKYAWFFICYSLLKSKEASSRRYCSARRGPQLAEPMPFCA